MNVKRINSCVICGIRVGAAQSVFCYRDAERLGIKLVLVGHRPHLFVWVKQATGIFYGRSVTDILKDLKPSRGAQ